MRSSPDELVAWRDRFMRLLARSRARKACLRGRAQDRRPERGPHLRERPSSRWARPVATAKWARTSRRTCGRCAPSPLRIPLHPGARSRPASRRRASSCAARHTLPSPTSRSSTRSSRKPACARMPTRAISRPARCASSTRASPPRVPIKLWLYQIVDLRGGAAIGSQWEALQYLRDLGFPVERRIRRFTDFDEMVEYVVGWGEARAPQAALRGRRAGHQDRRFRDPGAARVRRQGPALGRSPTSTRPKRPSPGCSTSGSTLGARARSTRTPCSNRSRWAG